MAMITAMAAGVGAGESEVVAVGGVIDLRNSNLEEHEPISLNGEWAFYWDIVVSQEQGNLLSGIEPDHYVMVPSYWDELVEIDSEITAQGTATYALEILVPPVRKTLALKFLNITPNAEIYVDGIRMAEIGIVDQDPAISRSGNNTMVIPLSNVGESIYLTVSVSNYHNVNGGLNRPIEIGFFEDILRNRERRLSMDAIFLGGLLLMGLYQFMLFLLHRSRKAPLFMAMFCLLAFFFSGFKHEMVLLALYPGWDGEVRTKFIFLSLALVPLVLSNYTHCLYPAHFQKLMIRIMAVISIVFALLILSTPKSVYTASLLFLEIFLAISSLYSLGMLVRGYLLSKDRLILFYLGGLLFLLASIAFSILDNAFSVVFQSVAGVFFIFILYQAFLQAIIYSYAFQEIDFLSNQKAKLEKRNVELFSLSYIDSLTDTCNRRLMDDFLASNWRVNALNGKTLGMILIDIDEFKGYNEYYGHRKGDACITRVSVLIRKELILIGQDTLARYGGEEFAVIISDIGEAEILKIAERLRIAVEHGGIEHRSSGTANVVTISLGCAIILPSMEEDPETLLDAAELALHQAKTDGRNRTVMHGADSGVRSWQPRLV